MFARIGITDGRYQEFESAEDPAEALATWALLNSAGEAEAPPADRPEGMPEDPSPRPTSFHERVAELRRRPAGLGPAPVTAAPANAVPVDAAVSTVAGDGTGAAPRGPRPGAGAPARDHEGTIVQTRRIVPRRAPPAGDPGAPGTELRPPTIMPHRTPTVVPRRPLRAAPPAERSPEQTEMPISPTHEPDVDRTVAAPRHRPAAHALPAEDATVVQQRRPAAPRPPPEDRTVVQPRRTAAEAPPAEDRTLVQPRRAAAAAHVAPPEDRTVVQPRRTAAEAPPTEDRTLVQPRRAAAAAHAAPPEDRTVVQPRRTAAEAPTTEDRTLVQPRRAAVAPRAPVTSAPPPRAEPAETLRRELRAGLGAPSTPARRRDETPEPPPAREEAPASKTPLQRVFARLGHGSAAPERDSEGGRRGGQTPLSQIFRRLS